MTEIPNLSPQTKPVAQPVIAPPKRFWAAWPAVGWGLLILAVFFFVQTVVMIIALVIMGFNGIDPNLLNQPDELVKTILDLVNAKLGLLQSIATIVSGILGTGLALVIIRGRKESNIKEHLGLKRINIKTALVSIIIVVLFNIAAGWIQTVLGGKAVEEQIMYDVYRTTVWPALFWVAVIVFAPLFEETLFRGFIFESFLNSQLGAIGAVVISAAAWAALHSFQYKIFSVLTILVLGLIMGVVRWRSKTIWSTFIMHAVMNLMAVIALEWNLNF